MIKELKQLLLQGNHSLIVANGGIHTYDGRGISDLYRLLNEAPELLNGASVADKVVGKAVAALMIQAGIKELYAEIISISAFEILDAYGITVFYHVIVKHISNRQNTGLCPMESCCENCRTPEECLAEIEKILIKTSQNDKR
ncbi:MAG: DUF1893 domain-containing protein [Prevotella sp.]